MIIGVDGNEANVEFPVGVSVYTLNLLNYFQSKSSKDIQFIIYLRQSPNTKLPRESEYFKYQVVRGKRLWLTVFLPLRLWMDKLSGKNITVFFSPAHYIPWFSPFKTIVTVHDLSYLFFPNEFLKKDLYQLRNWTKYALKKACHIIAVSKTTKKDIVKEYSVPDEKISVVYNGYDPSTSLRMSNLQTNIKPYFLYVGTIQPRKNLSTLIKAFSRFHAKHPSFKLIIAGKKGWLYDSIFLQVSQMQMTESIIFPGYVSDSEKIKLYQEATAYILPSFYEGFGIPILEAMSHKCPVISSFSSSLPEIGGEACLYFDPNSVNDLLDKMELIISDKTLVKDLIEKGIKRIDSFSWKATGKRTLEVLLPVNNQMKEAQNSLASHPMQTWEWGEARTAMGVEVIKIQSDGKLYQMTIHPIPHTPYSIGYIPRSEMPTQSALTRLHEFGKKNNVIFIKIEPYIPYDESFGPSAFNFQLQRSSHPLFPEWTQTLDLTPSEEELLKKMKPKTRYNIRLAEKKGVVIKEMSTDEGYKIFETLYFETCERQGYRGHTPSYHQTIWNKLKDMQAHILVAFLGEIPLAAYELLIFKKTLYYLYGGSSLLHKNVMAPNLLMWEAIKLGKKLGAELFDMWGSLPPEYSNTHPWAGFTRFKEGYGTQFLHLMPSIDIIIRPILYKTYGILHAFREKFYL